ncbi:adenylate/guanylate cyclase domain-containing protein [Rhodoferax sp.]|uniref:adenylate/guanylate cyclase domain-containing response regulator n=1 Tax=Rhodoferax sp. TaxID=50421 RepID=UPI0026389032|nr:adenylate/guanylate cyclase domain-containing protein [Rhodoferax sp.]MDD5479103.1 adenylate/guanylate cyclase domain-containing protein [Rhodoferax sp.]
MPSQNHLLIADSNAYTRSLLVERMVRLEGCALHVHASLADIQLAPSAQCSAILLLNHHATDAPPADLLAHLKHVCPTTQVLVIVSPGTEKRALEPLRKAGHIQGLIEKPIDPDALARQIQDEMARQNLARKLNSEHLNLLRFLPTGGLRRIFKHPEPGHAELFDMTVMFTDIRDSSRHIVASTAQDYFVRLNRILGEQARLIRAHDGMVVKTTGDGLLAVFEGAARCHLALKCAQAIQCTNRADAIGIGIGLSDGLVLTGILGTHEHVHFDVIGKHVHVAARLCALAAGGEILATQDTAAKAHFDFVNTPMTEAIQVKGFAKPVACAHIQPVPKE